MNSSKLHKRCDDAGKRSPQKEKKIVPYCSSASAEVGGGT